MRKTSQRELSTDWIAVHPSLTLAADHGHIARIGAKIIARFSGLATISVATG